MNKKAELFTVDFALAIVLFVGIISALMVNRNLMLDKINRQEDVLEKNRLGAIGDSLILQPGEPENWDLNDVEVIGLVNRPNELNITKVFLFSQMDYGKSKELLGIEDKFYFDLRRNGTVLEYGGINLTKGNKTWGESEDVSVIKRKVFLNGSLVRMRMVKW